MKFYYDMVSKYEHHQVEDASLPFTIQYGCYKPNQRFKSIDNWHENFELISVVGGNGIIYLNSKPYEVSSGDIVAINSNTLHTVETSSNGMSFCYIIIERGFCLENFCDTNKLWFRECFKDEQITELVNTLLSLSDIEEKKDWCILAIRSGILQLLSLLCKKHLLLHFPKQNEQHIFAAIKQGISYIRANYIRDLSLEEISSHVGLSRYYFTHEFRRITGYTFIEYVNLLRCEKAKKELLKANENIEAIGAKCGLPNRNYFTRTFKNYTGITPSEYRKQNLLK